MLDSEAVTEADCFARQRAEDLARVHELNEQLKAKHDYPSSVSAGDGPVATWLGAGRFHRIAREVDAGRLQRAICRRPHVRGHARRAGTRRRTRSSSRSPGREPEPESDPLTREVAP